MQAFGGFHRILAAAGEIRRAAPAISAAPPHYVENMRFGLNNNRSQSTVVQPKRIDA